MTDPRDDTDFDDYIDGDSPVSRRYARLASEEPPPELDAEILEAARRAVHPNVLPLKKSPRRWMVPLTVAATIVLSFSLVMSIVFDTSVMMTDGDMPLTTVGEENEIAPTESRQQVVEAQTPKLKVLLEPSASAPRAEAPAVVADEIAADRAKPARKSDATGLASQTIDAPTAGILRSESSVADAAEPARDASQLLAALRELAPRDDPELAETVEESRFRRENDAFIALQSTSSPEELDADGELGQILALFESDEETAALEALRTFSRSRPDHPASQIYLEWSGDAQ